MRVSVVVPAYRAESDLPALTEALNGQTMAPDEMILVDDASPDRTIQLAQSLGWRVLAQPTNGGPATARNRGLQESHADIVCFTDTDCCPEPDWLRSLTASIRLGKADCAVGNTRLRDSTYLGDCIGLLGFPGGGRLGFDRVWRVSAQGWASSFSSCNLAWRKAAFLQTRGFREDFPVPGGEDTVLAYEYLQAGGKIRYEPKALIVHEAITSLRRFATWMLVRGRGNYYIRRHVPKLGGFFATRWWHLGNLVRHLGFSPRLPIVLGLYLLAIVMQVWGMWREGRKAARQA